jgi:hypothetical protein
MKRLGILFVCLFLVACGDKGGTGVQQPFQQTFNGSVTAFGTTEHLFSAPRAGNMTIVLRWANAAIDLDLYLTAANCNQYPLGGCTLLGISDGVQGTQESITRQVSNGEQFKVWVDNWHQSLGSNYSVEININ